jgi:N-acetylglutamate synthase-like GNAT family acetyltransferase
MEIQIREIPAASRAGGETVTGPARLSEIPAISRLLLRNVPDVVPEPAAKLNERISEIEVVRSPAGRVIASASLHPIDERMAELRGLVVHEKWRGKGLARTLLARIVGRCRREGRTLVCVTKRSGFFHRLGFRPVRSRWERAAGLNHEGPRPRRRIEMIHPATGTDRSGPPKQIDPFDPARHVDRLGPTRQVDRRDPEKRGDRSDPAMHPEPPRPAAGHEASGPTTRPDSPTRDHSRGGNER